MALPLIQAEPDLNYYDNRLGDELENTSTDAALAAFQSGSENTIGNAFDDIFEMRRLRSQSTEMVDPRVLNEQYSDTGILFREATPNLVAEEMAKRARERNNIARRIGTGPDSMLQSMVNMGSSLGGSFYGMMTDPVDLGINIVAAPFTVGRFGMAAANMGRLGVLASEGLGGVLARGAAEGLVTGALSTPVLAFRDSQEGRDWSAMDALKNMGQEIFTSAGFAGLAHGVAKGWKYMRRTDKASEASGLLALDQVSVGKRPNVQPIEALFREHMAARAPEAVNDFSGRVHYKSSSFTTDKPVSGKFFYSTREGVESPQALSGKVSQSLYSQNYGDGVYLVNDAVLANNVVASGFQDTGSGGRVIEADLKDAKLFNADAPMRTSELAIVRTEIEKLSAEAGRDLSKFLPDGASVSDVFDFLENSPNGAGAMERINKHIKDSGYDGYAFMDPNGKSDGSQGVMLFDDAKVSMGRTFETDSRLLSSSIEKVLQEYDSNLKSPDTDIFSNKTDIDSYNKSVVSMESFVEDKEIELQLEDVNLRLADMESKGLLSKEELDLLSEIKQADSKASFGEKVIKAAFYCVGRS